MSEAKREAMLIQLMRDVCEEVGLPEEKQERAPILEALNAAFNKGAESAQPAERAGEWVSVEERLPEPGRYVVFWVHSWLPTPGLGPFLDDEHGQRWLDETQMEGYENDEPKRHYTHGANVAGVTHWMPLPPPPQPKGFPVPPTSVD